MGTNYYFVAPGQPTPKPCPTCGHTHKAEEREKLHIGKSSFGWAFSLHVMPERGLKRLADWIALINEDRDGWVIEDEYGVVITLDSLLEMIRNCSTINRAAIDNKYCLGRDGNCDLIPGEFS